MTTQEIANQLITLCRAGQGEEAYKTLFSQDAKSIEPMENGTTEGLVAMHAKSAQWAKTFEVHDMKIGEVIVADNYFATTFYLDSTNRHTNQRTKSSEIALYRVKDGKIVSEQFFYDMMG